MMLVALADRFGLPVILILAAAAAVAMYGAALAAAAVLAGCWKAVRVRVVLRYSPVPEDGSLTEDEEAAWNLIAAGNREPAGNFYQTPGWPP
jgi:hypothetical protein